MWRAVLCLIALMVVGDAMAQSQRPSPRGREQRQTQPAPAQQNPATNEQAPALPAPIINILPPQKTDAERAEEAHERQEKAELDRRLVKLTEDLAIYTARLYYATLAVAIATVFLVLATAGLTWLGRIQLRDMKASIAVAKDAAAAARDQVRLSCHAMESTERAMVFHSKTHAMAGIKGSTNEVIDWTIFAIFENAGSTPTRWMRMHTNWFYFAGGIPDDYNFPDLGATAGSVPISMGPKGITWSGECEIPIDKVLATRNGEGQLFVWGWVEYDDIFEGTPRHRTEYCFEVKVPGIPTIHTAEGNPEGAHVPFRYQGYKKHNGTDEECMHPIKTGSP